jgi:hypothetical protein
MLMQVFWGLHKGGYKYFRPHPITTQKIMNSDSPLPEKSGQALQKRGAIFPI